MEPLVATIFFRDSFKQRLDQLRAKIKRNEVNLFSIRIVYSRMLSIRAIKSCLFLGFCE